MKSFGRDVGGAAALEFALTAPAFFAFIIGIITTGLAIYAQLALQHSVEMAARCASVNTTTCSTTSEIQQYAVGQSYGLTTNTSTFSVTTPACGNQVQANYVVSMNFGPIGTKSVTLTASSCFPK
ncbi:MAG: pilus assembly protein [Alphaproteobacteria bacterium]|nr:pilus assembly protein [Alphaproteobacteria bacterium]